MKRLLRDVISTLVFWIKEAWEFRQKKKNEKCILRIIIETITDMRYL